MPTAHNGGESEQTQIAQSLLAFVVLNDRLKQTMGAAYQLGHAYLVKEEEEQEDIRYSVSELVDIWRFELIPQLRSGIRRYGDCTSDDLFSDVSGEIQSLLLESALTSENIKEIWTRLATQTA